MFADAPGTSHCTAGLRYYAQVFDTLGLVILCNCSLDVYLGA